MSLAVVYSRALAGLDAPLVRVEVHVGGGLPCTHIVGLPEKEVREARDRVRAALWNARFDSPGGRVTVNLAPADLPKESGRFDLPIAIGILAASRQLASIHPKVAASLLPAKRLDFAAIAASARSAGAQVVSMGKAKKPGLFASGKRREEYRLRQANATAAQAEMAKLEQLSGAIAAVTTSAAADSAISQAKAIHAKLRELQASSAAAMPQGAEEPAPAKAQ